LDRDRGHIDTSARTHVRLLNAAIGPRAPPGGQPQAE
jgi:hypothetical protein